MVNRVLKYIPILIITGALIFVTRDKYFGDTPAYVENIDRFIRGAYKPGENPLWDSGHLLLRPLGWALYRLITAVFPAAGAADRMTVICWCLIGASIASGFATVLLLRSLSERFLNTSYSRNFLVAGFLCFYSFLNYVQTGTSYIIGLMWITLAVWLAVRAAESKTPSRGAILAGASAALAALFWLPYICVLPGVLAVVALWTPQTGRGRARLVVAAMASAALLLGAVYIAVIAQLHLQTASQVISWLVASGHGSSPRRKQLLRIATGLPRSFLWLGNEGVLMKRYVLHDPYAPVTLAQIVREELWRMLAFYAFLACVLWTLPRCRGGMKLLVILSFAALPLLFFALFVFEPGSAERYLPIVPFLFLAVALCVERTQSQLARIIIVGFLVVEMITNVSYLSGVSGPASRATVERALALRDKVGPNGEVAVLTLLDDLYILSASVAWDPRAPVHIHLPVYDVVQIGNERIRRWRQEFAARTSRVLDAGESAWISKRLIAEKPDPSWNWTEGDDLRISWKDLRPFFIEFDYSEDVGGADGFLRLQNSPRNRQILNAILSQAVEGKAASVDKSMPVDKLARNTHRRRSGRRAFLPPRDVTLVAHTR